MPYYPSDAWDTVFAVGDIHGDVGLTIRLFCDVIGVVKYTHTNTWEWVAPAKTCVVVCGDVLDRSRKKGVSGDGENKEQKNFPDDYYVLLLLNEWSKLAKTHECAILRILGNHDIQVLPGYSSDKGNELLLIKDKICGGTQNALKCRELSFQKGLYFDAIWSGNPSLYVQIGSWFFTHSGEIETKRIQDMLKDETQSLASIKKQMQNGKIDALFLQFVSGRSVLTKTAEDLEILMDTWNRHHGHAIQHMVIGHNPQSITTRCNSRGQFSRYNDRVNSVALQWKDASFLLNGKNQALLNRARIGIISCSANKTARHLSSIASQIEIINRF